MNLVAVYWSRRTFLCVVLKIILLVCSIATVEKYKTKSLSPSLVLLLLAAVLLPSPGLARCKVKESLLPRRETPINLRAEQKLCYSFQFSTWQKIRDL